jgi:colanic acid/amylovoran biosynthesis glycosyltransferase
MQRVDGAAMKIAVVSGVFPTLSETFVLNQVTGLLELGHDVRVLAGRPGDEPMRHPEWTRQALGDRTTYWESPHRILRRLRHRLHRYGLCSSPAQPVGHLAPQGRFDAVLCHFGHVGEQMRSARDAGLIQGPLAVVFHAYDLTVLLREVEPGFYDELFASAELLLPISHYWAAKLVALGAPEDRIRVHRMGIDTGLFRARTRTRDEGAVTELVSTARLTEKKGIATAIRAVAAVLRRQSLPLRYRIIGDGPLRSELEALAEAEGAGEAIEFLGWRDADEVATVLAESHLFLLPSETGENGDMEGIPVSLMEAMACAMPVLTTLHGGIPELVEDGGSGFLVAERDHAALADRLEELMHDPARWVEMGLRGRERVEAEFDVNKNNQTLVSLLAGEC